MRVIPSIDLQPAFSRTHAGTVAGAVLDWERAGFATVHLAAAVPDELPDARLIEDVVRDVHIPVQVAGRFEAAEDVDAVLAAGASFVVLGNRAMDEIDWLASVASRFPGQLLAVTPARERRARSRGVVRTLPLDLRDIAAEIASMPIAGLIVEFSPDATLGHAELALLEDVAEDVPFAIQVSGCAPALATLRDLEFRGVGAAIIDTARLSAEFDGQTLARDFAD